MAKHGDYDPAKGWYSEHTKAWHSDPKKIGTLAPKYEPTEWERQEFAKSSWGGKRDFKAQPQMEQLIKLRDSDRPDDRAKFERIARGSTRVTLHDYEAAKAKSEGATDGAA